MVGRRHRRPARGNDLLNDIETIKRKYDEFDPKQAETFADFPLSDRTSYGLEKGNFIEPTDIQRESIGLALRGCDVLGAAMTGSGKTLAFLIPILEILWRERWSPYDGVGALIISPTRELAMQIYDVLRLVGSEHDFSAALVVGGTDVKYEAQRMAGKNIVVGTPGRLLQHMDENANFSCDNMRVLVIDEADRLLDMGFEGQLNAIISNLPAQRQTLLFSATQTKSVKDLARLSLKDPVYVSVHEHAKYSTPEQLKQTYVICEDHEKINTLWSFVKNHQQAKLLVFMANCKQVRFMYEAFRKFRPHTTILSLHGSMVQTKRVNVYQQFCNKNYVVLLATDIAARGLDFPFVDWVVQMDCPPDSNEYIHRCGRTARYHRDGKSLLVLTPSQEMAMIDDLRSKKIPISKITTNASMLVDVQQKLATFCSQDTKFKALAQQAFVAYVRSIFLMSNKKIFDVKSIDYEAMARSYGLAITPRIRFLRKQTSSSGNSGSVYSKPPNPVNEEDDGNSAIRNTGKNALLEVAPQEDVKEFSGWENHNEDEEEEDLLIVKQRDIFKVKEQEANEEGPSTIETQEVPNKSRRKQPLTREALAKKIIRKKIVANKKVTFDDEGDLATDSKAQDSALRGSEDDETGYRIDVAKKLMEIEDKNDRQLYRKRIKEKHKEEKRKKKLAEMEKRQKGRKMVTLGRGDEGGDAEEGGDVEEGTEGEEDEGLVEGDGHGISGPRGESGEEEEEVEEEEEEELSEVSVEKEGMDVKEKLEKKKRRLPNEHVIQRGTKQARYLTLQDAEQLALKLLDAENFLARMATFKRTTILPAPRSKDVTEDTLYWKRLDFPVTVKEYGAVSSIEFSQSQPYYYAVTCGMNVQIYESDTNQVWRSISRFKAPAYGASFRRDGKLLAVGGEENYMKLFTVETGGQLRVFKGHKGAVNACKFLSDGYRLASFSNDQRIRLWDIATEKCTTRLKGHEDVITCGCVGTSSPDMVVSGSSDKTVRVWDVREGKETVQVDHGWPVQAVLLFPNDALLVTAGGTVVKVWDLVAGGRQLIQLSQHHKNVTSLSLCSDNRRLLSAGEDRHIKVYDVATYDVVHTLDYPAPILAMGISPDDSVIAVGMTDGLVSTQRRKPEKETTSKPARRRGMSMRYMIGKGAEYVPSDSVEKEEKTGQLPRYDHFLRTFQHSRALDTVLVGTFFTEGKPEVTVAVLQELIRREALKSALAGRQYDSLAKLITFIAKNIGRPRFTKTLLDVSLALLDVYEDQMDDMDEKMIQIFGRLHNSISVQVDQTKEMSRMLGQLEMMASMAETPSQSVEPVDDDDDAQPEDEDIIIHEVREVNEMTK